MIRRNNVIVVYDITDDKRRRALFKTLKGFGIRTQYSFFECRLSDKQLEKLRFIIKSIIKPSKGDCVGIMLLCDSCHSRIERLGYDRPEIFESDDLII